MDRVDEPTDEDEVSFAPTPSPEEARARLAALRGKSLDAPSRLVTEEAPAAEPEVVTSPAPTEASRKSSFEIMPLAMVEAWRKFLEGEALKAEPQKPAKADKPLFKVVKVRITTRIDADVLAAFKAEGGRWQTRINDVLRANMPRSAPTAED